MTSDPDGAGATGVLRIAPDQLPRNHHGDPVAPLTPAGLPYQLRWVDHDHGGDLVYAETADDLLAHWLPDYTAADPAEQALLRAQHAVQIRDGLVAQLLVDAENNGITLTPEQESILLADPRPDARHHPLGPTRPARPARRDVPALHHPHPTAIRPRRRRPRTGQHHLAAPRLPRHLPTITRRCGSRRPRHL